MPRGKGSGRGLCRRQGKRIAGGLTNIVPGGECVCPTCGETIAHEAGVSCRQVKCPKCGAGMIRKQ